MQMMVWRVHLDLVPANDVEEVDVTWEQMHELRHDARPIAYTAGYSYRQKRPPVVVRKQR